MTCELGNKPGVSWGICDPDDCRTCGWETHELARRKEAIRSGGVRWDAETGKYCLKVRKEHENDGYDDKRAARGV